MKFIKNKISHKNSNSFDKKIKFFIVKSIIFIKNKTFQIKFNSFYKKVCQLFCQKMKPFPEIQ